MFRSLGTSLLASVIFVAFFVANADASIFLDTVAMPAAVPDWEAVNDALDNQNDLVDDTIVVDSNDLLAKIGSDGLEEGSLVGSFEVFDGDGNSYGDGDTSVYFTFTNVPLIEEPFYITVKYGNVTDVYQWDTSGGEDMVTDNGDGTYNYQSMVYEVSSNSISHIAVLGEAVPEPASIFGFAGLGICAGFGAWRRRRSKRK
jgi:hypothetical protein